MDPDELFLSTLHDLEQKIRPDSSEYDALMSASLMRKLLLDPQPLTDLVNRDRRLKLTYRINVGPQLWQLAGGPRPAWWSLEDALDPDTALLRPG